MERRSFVALIGSALALPRLALAQRLLLRADRVIE
jgi:hypothetical protein